MMANSNITILKCVNATFLTDNSSDPEREFNISGNAEIADGVVKKVSGGQVLSMERNGFIASFSNSSKEGMWLSVDGGYSGDKTSLMGAVTKFIEDVESRFDGVTVGVE